MSRTNTKEAILFEGARLIHEKGYNNTGLQEILAAAGVPKGSFYFYFRNKEDFGLQVIDSYAAFINAMAGKYFADDSVPPLKRLENLFDAYLVHFEGLNLCYGCPIGNLMQEMSDLNESFRRKIGSVCERICDLIAECIRQGQNEGDIPLDIEAAEAAQFIFDSWEGAVMHMKLARSTRPLITFKKMLMAFLLKQRLELDA